jgi:hypothetical protein
MRLLLLRFEAEIRGARAPFFCSRAPRAVVSLRPPREGRRRRRTGEGGFPLGCLRLFCSRSDDADGGARQQGYHGARRSCSMARYHAPGCLMNA